MFIIFRGYMVILRSQLLICGICVSKKKKKKIPFPRQISREGTDEKHMSFFVWPNDVFSIFYFFGQGGQNLSALS